MAGAMCVGGRRMTGSLPVLTGDTAAPAFRSCHTERRENPHLPPQPLTPAMPTAALGRGNYNVRHRLGGSSLPPTGISRQGDRPLLPPSLQLVDPESSKPWQTAPSSILWLTPAPR
ncbi:Hypothetical predicted protein [Pelobates cultripes]|uniref:Uncharacterized protein n=1 Tax=Pelobates cultripes TaxID=61616 RepID=A0AAD1TCN7_PELCU|nr:Hypothetical predicted protein [Pelobates cultripes]